MQKHNIFTNFEQQMLRQSMAVFSREHGLSKRGKKQFQENLSRILLGARQVQGLDLKTTTIGVVFGIAEKKKDYMMLIGGDREQWGVSHVQK